MSELLHSGEHSAVYLDDTKGLIRKYPMKYLELGVLYREAYWTQQFYQMGYVEGGCIVRANLGEPLTKNNCPVDTDVQVYQILLALAEKGCCHNDIKPDNILVNKKHQLKLIDFAWATWNGEDILDSWPKTIGSTFKCPEGFDDEYSLRKSLEWVASGGGK